VRRDQCIDVLSGLLIICPVATSKQHESRAVLKLSARAAFSS